MKKKKRKRKIYNYLFNKGNNNKYQIMPKKNITKNIFITLNKKEQNKNNNNMIKRRM